MLSFIFRRILQLLFILWGGATLLFILFFALPSDPAELMAGSAQKTPNPQVVENIRNRFNLDDPIPVQYINYLKKAVTLDLGTSYTDGREVTEIISERLPNSVRLASWAMFVEVIAGVGFGVIAARKRNSLSETGTTIFAVVASAIPVFLLAYLLKQITGVYAFQHHWPEWARLPTFGIGPNSWHLGFIPSAEQLEYLVQPTLVLASVSTAVVARLTRAAMLEVNNAEYVRTAHAKGISERKVVRKHILRNASIPIVTYLGIDFGTLIGAAILTESVFNWPGIGSKVADAARAGDGPVVIGLSLLVILIYGLTSLAVDVSYAALDPRIRMDAKHV